MIPPLVLFCLILLIFLTNPIVMHKTVITDISIKTVTAGIAITATIETTARKRNKCLLKFMHRFQSIT